MEKSNTRLTFMENSVLPVGKEISDVVSLKINGKVEGIYSGNVIIMTNDTNPAQARVEIGYKSEFCMVGYLCQVDTIILDCLGGVSTTIQVVYQIQKLRKKLGREGLCVMDTPVLGKLSTNLPF